MRKNYSVYMFGAFLGTGSLIGLAFASIVRFLIVVPENEVIYLYSLALGAGLVSGAAIFLINYSFILSIIGHFREILARIHEEDYSARVSFSGRDMIGLLAEDVNCALEHLEEKNDEVLHDELTGLPNRQFLKQHYRKNSDWLAQQKTAFLFFDLDKFKEINDQYGHLYGDKVLIEVAERIRAALAEDEFLVRLSGDEFLLVAKLSEDCTGKDLAEQLMALFFEPFNINGSLQQLQTSIGVSTAPTDGENLAELIRKADFAMYKAKKQEGLSYYLFQQQDVARVSEMVGPC
ncbi:GGDEF domain-containing protein [Planococcus halotolerans]|uniref:GGDEF domain-containing protein n=1 Tax=Planococcus halotolerans TaxID=2233542 RepID=UPI001091E646|nr:GGDEF domain-containing protein [Planococcus halotolerans]QHJ70127.1 diguanylate cyclase [Planococcus halotolerans]